MRMHVDEPWYQGCIAKIDYLSATGFAQFVRASSFDDLAVLNQKSRILDCFGSNWIHEILCGQVNLLSRGCLDYNRAGCAGQQIGEFHLGIPLTEWMRLSG